VGCVWSTCRALCSYQKGITYDNYPPFFLLLSSCCNSFDNKSSNWRLLPKDSYWFLISALLLLAWITAVMQSVWWWSSDVHQGNNAIIKLSPMYTIILLSNHQVVQLGEPHHGSRLSLPWTHSWLQFTKPSRKFYICLLSLSLLPLSREQLIIPNLAEQIKALREKAPYIYGCSLPFPWSGLR